VKIWPNIDQQSEQWFRVRAGRPTASQFSRIITPTGKDSAGWHDFATELAAESIRPDELPAFAGNRHTDRGNELEPEAREFFAATMGLEVREVGFVTRDDGIVGCSPDGIIYRDGEPVAGLEIKCPTGKNHALDLIAGELPAKHRPQVHGGMAVTGFSTWYFLSYCPGFAPLMLKVDRDGYTDALADALDRFLVFYAAHRKQWIPLLTGKGEAK
jgi:hypothetical protein